MKNIELFAEVLEYIKANPKQWNQSSWGTVGESLGFCGCFAGHLVHTVLGRPVSGAESYLVYTTALMETFGLSADEEDFLTRQERTIEDFKFFLRNESITNPDNGRIEDAYGYDVDGVDEDGCTRVHYR
jgi:hypothetical protein